jgi:hypothetical protein
LLIRKKNEKKKIEPSSKVKTKQLKRIEAVQKMHEQKIKLRVRKKWVEVAIGIKELHIRKGGIVTRPASKSNI